MTTSYQWLQQSKGLLVAKLNFTCSIGVGHAQIEMCFKDELSVPVASVNAEAIRSNFATNLKPYWSSLANLQQCQVTMWDGTTLQQATTNDTQVAGTGSSNPVSPAVALLIKKNTGVIGRSNRGRFYMPYMGTTLLYQPDQISTSTKTALDLALLTFLTALTTGGNQLAPWLIKKTENPALNHNVAVTSFTSETMLATQRRRQRKAAHR
jgi:hypothetical protein